MSQSLQATLTVDFIGYWHTGSGTGAGHHVDALCLRDPAGLPFVPGRQLKGLLRHAVRRAQIFDWFTEPVATDAEAMLFGSGNQQADRFGTEPGMLLVDNAELPEVEYAWLAQPEQALEREQLFTELYNTAIDADGTAKDKSLRGMEVCLPMQLQAELTLAVTALTPQRRAEQQAWLASDQPWQALEISLPLIDALGANRSRGLGEARLSLHAANHKECA